MPFHHDRGALTKNVKRSFDLLIAVTIFPKSDTVYFLMKMGMTCKQVNDNPNADVTHSK